MYWNELLNYIDYRTYKVVVIKDFRYGLAYYTCVTGIVAFIATNMYYNGSYLEKSAPIASSVTLLAQFASQNLAVPSYCGNSTWNSGCVFWTPEQIVFPFAGEIDSLFITTRVSFTEYSPAVGCNAGALLTTALPTTAGCRPQVNGTKTTFYVANAEDLVLRIDHSVRYLTSIVFGDSKTGTLGAQEMYGDLISGCNGNDASAVIKSFDVNYRNTAKSLGGTSLDVISIGDLLRASNCDKMTNFNLDAVPIVQADGAKPAEPIRSSGMIISMPIFYINRQSIKDPSQIVYRYIPSVMHGSEVKISTTIQNPDGTLTNVDRHGIRLVLSQTGQIGVFSFMQLVLNFVAGFGLLSIATFIMDRFIAAFSVYAVAKYQNAIMEGSRLIL